MDFLKISCGNPITRSKFNFDVKLKNKKVLKLLFNHFVHEIALTVSSNWPGFKLEGPFFLLKVEA